MTVACIVQARLGSTRLPAKVLLPLPTGILVLEEVLWRCAMIKGVDVVVAAIPDTGQNDLLVGIVENAFKMLLPKHVTGICVRGPEHDVLARYAKAAAAVKADIIMRITADCPLIDPQLCARVLIGVCEACPLGYNNEPRTYPHGLDCEVFTRSLLERADREATDPYDREHVTPWMRRSGVSTWGPCSLEDHSHLRWTLDTLEDYVRIWGVMEQQMREAA